jgi:murein DD-endopeptidase MepM/ murein hydrolase activator NlpD
MRRIIRDLQGFAVLLLALLFGAFLLLRNSQPVVGDNHGVPESPTPTATPLDSSWANIIRTELVNDATAHPTGAPQPSLAPSPQPESTLSGPVVWSATATPTRFVPSQGPTRAAPTAAAVASNGPDVRTNNDPRRGEFSPPPEQVPLSMDPRDHFYFRRPVDASANSSEIFWYVYGSDGPQNEWRIHTGIDLPNPIGKDVHAAGPGRVIWASDQYAWPLENGRIQTAYPYGNVVIIEHDFGYEGQKLFTLYAHLAKILVVQNQHVETGDVIGLSGQSGIVSGPHVHFEVRVGKNDYFETRNPILWVVPFENHGIIAGRILYQNGQPVQDVTVYLYQNGRLVDTTTTYADPRWTSAQRGWHVTPDDVWREDFVIGDVPMGTYQVFANVNGVRYSQTVIVRPATTSFVDLNLSGIEPTPSG